MQETTIARPVRFRGIGLHSGAPAVVTVQPARAGTGLLFVVPNEAGEPACEIPARPASVLSTARATTLGLAAGGDSADCAPARSRVATVEHLLAALYALGIHDARIVVEGGEVPVLDGSAARFATRLRRAGLRGLGVSRRELEVTQTFEIVEGERWIRVSPGEGLRIEYAIDFERPGARRQTYVLARLDAESFERELAPARTFGFAHEVEALRALGLARGGDLSNTLVLGDTGLVNPGGLRFPDELVRHKVVDLLGDLALLGAELNASVTVEKGGHGLHHALVRALIERPGLAVERPPRKAATGRRAGAQPG